MKKSVILNSKGETSVVRYHHPWVYRSSVSGTDGNPENGDIVRIVNSSGRVLGWGFFSERSLIPVRVFAIGEDEPEGDWLERRLERAALLRRELRIDSDAYRLVNGEGDFIPGLIVDVYGNTVVVKPQIRGTELLIDRVRVWLESFYPHKSIFLKRDERAARVEMMECRTGYIKGEGDGREVITETGLQFHVDLKEGQKTGFYLDQRESRSLAGMLSQGKRVLNLFSYTGAFSLYASRGNAKLVDSIEHSKAAIELARKNEELNREKLSCALNWIQGDVFDFLSDMSGYDFIIVDPPPFARKRGELKGAIHGYERLNLAVIRATEPGGYLMTFSCSQAVEVSLFREIIMKQALRAERNVTLLKELFASPDHTVSVYHPEGSYLKGFLLKIW